MARRSADDAAQLLREACATIRWPVPVVGSLDEVSAWLLEHCEVIREREGRKRAIAAVKLALDAARDGDADLCRREIIKAAFWWNDGHGAFSLSRAEDPEVHRDEARVLGLLAAVRVYGKALLPGEEPEAPTQPIAGLWVRARWRHAAHEPVIPIDEVEWATFGEEPRSQPGPAALWWQAEGGSPLRPDRVTRAVSYLLLFETMSEELTTIAVLRRVRERLQEAHRRDWAGADAKRAIAKAKAAIRSHLGEEERQREQAAAKLERLPTGLRALAPEEGRAQAWPYLETVATLARRFDARQGPYPLSHLANQLERAATPTQLAELYELLRRMTEREPRRNTNFAVHLQEILTTDHWSASTAARLWYRAQHGPNPKREKQLIQQVDAKLRDQLRTAKKRSGGG